MPQLACERDTLSIAARSSASVVAAVKVEFLQRSKSKRSCINHAPCNSTRHRNKPIALDASWRRPQRSFIRGQSQEPARRAGHHNVGLSAKQLICLI